MSTETTEAWLDEARNALRRRQGGGARWDAPGAPHADLALARRGVAYFARQMNALSKVELNEPTWWHGKPRREVAARIAYFARGLAVEAAEMRGAASGEVEFRGHGMEDAVVLATTLPDEALRHLVDHSAVHLNCEWRDLEDLHWSGLAPDTASVRQKPLLWAWANWLAGVTIGRLARLDDLPKDFLQAVQTLGAVRGRDPLTGTLLEGLTMDAVRGDQRINS